MDKFDKVMLSIIVTMTAFFFLLLFCPDVRADIITISKPDGGTTTCTTHGNIRICY